MLSIVVLRRSAESIRWTGYCDGRWGRRELSAGGLGELARAAGRFRVNPINEGPLCTSSNPGRPSLVGFGGDVVFVRNRDQLAAFIRRNVIRK
jgi:hypothetical protein